MRETNTVAPQGQALAMDVDLSDGVPDLDSHRSWPNLKTCKTTTIKYGKKTGGKEYHALDLHFDPCRVCWQRK